MSLLNERHCNIGVKMSETKPGAEDGRMIIGLRYVGATGYGSYVHSCWSLTMAELSRFVVGSRACLF
jgi:hypothetical protein